MQDQKLTLFHANWSFCSQMVRVALFELNVHFNEQHIRLCDQYAEGENLDKNFMQVPPPKPEPTTTTLGLIFLAFKFLTKKNWLRTVDRKKFFT